MIYLDPGHGGDDSGATTDYGKHWKEKNIVLALSKQIESAFIHRGMSYETTRNNDSFIGLDKRVQKANTDEATIFISIHANYFDDNGVSGYEVHHYPRSKNGSKLAKNVSDALSCQDYIPQRSIKQSEFYVLRNTLMPAVLIETGFISNNSDRVVLTDLTKTQHIAYHIVDGIENYLNKD